MATSGGGIRFWKLHGKIENLVHFSLYISVQFEMFYSRFITYIIGFNLKTVIMTA